MRRRSQATTRKFSLGCIFLASLALMIGCAAPPANGPTVGSSGPNAGPKRIVAAINSNPPTLSSSDIGAGSGTYQGGDAIEDLINGGLAVVDNRSTLVPQLSEMVPSTDNGLWQVFPDGTMETRWSIKPQAAWHDGVPFTSKDLLFTMTLSKDKDLPIFANNALDYVVDVQAPDDHTVAVLWSRPFVSADLLFTRRLAFPRPAHILGPAYVDRKDTVLSSPYWREQFVGTGPFKVKQWVADSHVVLQANEQYILGRPKLDEVEVRFIPDPNTLVANLLAGEIELTLGRSLQVSDTEQIKDRWTGTIGVGIDNWIALWVQFIGTNPPILMDVRMRRTLLYSINRQEMVDAIEYGSVPVAHSFLNPTDAAYPQIESRIVKYDYDPRKATQLLEDLGFRRSADGLVRDASGQTLPLDVRTNPGHEQRIQAIANYFKAVGIAAEPFVIPDSRRSDREYDDTYPGVRLWRLPNNREDVVRFHSRESPLPENRFAGANRSRYSNPEFDALIDRYTATIPLNQRISILSDIVFHMTDQLPEMGINFNAQPMLAAARIRNVIIRGVGGSTEAWNAASWDVAG
ncbi:MAG TPA: peptide ABC transporter substrate-binding protein [Chloroflexota bacterium]